MSALLVSYCFLSGACFQKESLSVIKKTRTVACQPKHYDDILLEEPKDESLGCFSVHLYSKKRSKTLQVGQVFHATDSIQQKIDTKGCCCCCVTRISSSRKPISIWIRGSLPLVFQKVLPFIHPTAGFHQVKAKSVSLSFLLTWATIASFFSPRRRPGSRTNEA